MNTYYESRIGIHGSGSGHSLVSSSADWNKIVPRKYRHAPQRGEIQYNTHVRSPFKQDRSASTLKQKRAVEPDKWLKHQTMLATYEVAKTIAKHPAETERLISGRLLKARWKTMNTVNLTGPSINQCRGIIAGSHDHAPSPNRTLQRRKRVLNTLNADYTFMTQTRVRPQTAESIHHTSVASDSIDVRDIIDDPDYMGTPTLPL